MQLKRLQSSLEQFQDFLSSPEAEDRLYMWESQRIFQENWELEALDLAAMYNRSLENTQTRRLWSREFYEPKRLMHQFMRQQPDFVRQMFADLFNDDRSIDGRISRFVFGCDELLRDHQERHPRDRTNSHYHDDGYQIISLYLAFRYPDRYTYYDFALFRSTLENLGAPDLPATHDFERFVKVSRTIYNFMQKNDALMESHRARLDPEKHFQGDSLLLVYDFMEGVGKTVDGGR